MYARLFLLLLPIFFIACSSIERKPNCVQNPNSQKEVKCEQEKAPESRSTHGGYRERP